MFYFFKIIYNLILPPGSLLIVLVLGYFASKTKRFKWSGILLMILSFLIFYGISTGYFAHNLMHTLEYQYHPLENVDKDIDAIVVLTAGTQILKFGDNTYEKPSGGTLLRLLEGVHFYKKIKKPLIVSGGSGDPARKTLSEASLVKTYLINDLGVPLEDIIIESKSRSTLEEAKYTADLLTKRSMNKRILLCTSAFHMKRSVQVFKDYGFEVIPAPTGYYSELKELHINSFMPKAENLYISSIAISEYIIYYGYKALNFLGIKLS